MGGKHPPPTPAEEDSPHPSPTAAEEDSSSAHSATSSAAAEGEVAQESVALTTAATSHKRAEKKKAVRLSAVDEAGEPKDAAEEVAVAVPALDQLRAAGRARVLGLVNLGNKCFANSVLGVLIPIPSFAFPLIFDRPFFPRLRNPVVTALRGIAEAAWLAAPAETDDKATSVYNPREFIAHASYFSYQLRGLDQQDAHDFLIWLLNYLQDELKVKLSDRELSVMEVVDLQPIDTGRPAPASGAAAAAQMRPPQHVDAPPQLYFASEVSRVFEGKILSNTHCLRCNKVFSRVEPFFDVSLSLPNKQMYSQIDEHLAQAAQAQDSDGSGTAGCELHTVPGVDVSADLATEERALAAKNTGYFTRMLDWANLRTASYTLMDCLRGFVARERMAGESQYSCDVCRCKTDSEKFYSFLSLPEVLCIHVKRFRYPRGVTSVLHSNKISTHVSFPLRGLDFRPYMASEAEKARRLRDVLLCKRVPIVPATVRTATTTESEHDTTTPTPAPRAARIRVVEEPLEELPASSLFDLSGVVTHVGSSLSGGHYVAYVLDGEQWCRVSDTKVEQVSEKDVARAEAYILIYRRVVSPEMRQLREAVHRALQSKKLQWEDCTHLLATDWLYRFFSSPQPGPINNFSFACPHHLVSPLARTHDCRLRDGSPRVLRRMTAVPERIYSQLQRVFHGGPEVLRARGVCRQCQESLSLLRQRERETVRAVDSRVLGSEEDACWYLVHAGWLSSWINFTKYDSAPPPGPITNNLLLVDNMRARRGLERVKDYRGVNRAVWTLLYNAYGGGPPIRRTKIDIYSAVPGLLRRKPSAGGKSDASPSSARSKGSSGAVSKLKKSF